MNMIQLTNEDFEKIKNADSGDRLELSCGHFYVNGFDENRYIYEIVGQKLCKAMGLFCPPYYAVKLDDGWIATISKDLNDLGKYVEFNDLSKSEDTDYDLYSIWTYLERNGPFSFKIMVDVIKMYIFDILFLNYDRHCCNFGFLYTDSEEPVLTLIDHEFTFDEGGPYANIKVDHYPFTLYDTNTARLFDTNIADLELFLKESSIEFVEIFLYYFHLVDRKFLENILCSIEKEYPVPQLVKDSILESYDENRLVLQKMINKVLGKVFFRSLLPVDLERIMKTKTGVLDIGGIKYYIDEVEKTEVEEIIIVGSLLNNLEPVYQILNINGHFFILGKEAILPKEARETILANASVDEIQAVLDDMEQENFWEKLNMPSFYKKDHAGLESERKIL